MDVQSTRILAQELSQRRHPISQTKVAQLVYALDYSLQVSVRRTPC
jgi:hypothetical protein